MGIHVQVIGNQNQKAKAAQRAIALRAFFVLLTKLLEINVCPTTNGKADTCTRLRHV